MLASRSAGGGVMSAALASLVERPYSCSLVVDMTEMRLRTRAGCSMAMAWAIMPPIDMPITWAPAMPSASSSPMPSAAKSPSV